MSCDSSALCFSSSALCVILGFAVEIEKFKNELHELRGFIIIIASNIIASNNSVVRVICV